MTQHKVWCFFFCLIFNGFKSETKTRFYANRFFFCVCDMMQGDYIQHIMIEDILIHSLKCPFVLYMQFHLLPRM